MSNLFKVSFEAPTKDELVEDIQLATQYIRTLEQLVFAADLSVRQRAAERITLERARWKNFHSQIQSLLDSKW